MSRSVFVCAALVLLAASPALGFGTQCKNNVVQDSRIMDEFPAPTEMPANLKVAMLGDAGDDFQQKAVLTMIKEWGADFVIHLGDFDYESDPENFENNIIAVFGDSYPYFAAIGNHDADEWRGKEGYQARLIAQLERANVTQYCTGEYGVKMACYYKGLYFILSGVGTMGVEHVEYIDAAFSAQPAIWKVCSWHKNQNAYQTGGKSNEVGYAAYDICREHGAIVATGHEHSYARSYMMNDYQAHSVANYDEDLVLTEGESFVFCSGLAGKSIREWVDDLNENPWWASCAASDNGVSDGSLLCTFNIDGDARAGYCEFVDRTGVKWDAFNVSTALPETRATRSSGTPACARSSFHEFAVSRSEDDAHVSRESIKAALKTAILGDEDGTLALHFRDVTIPQGATVLNAHLQFKGRSNLEDANPMLKIRVEAAADSLPLAEMALEDRRFSRPVGWTSTPEGWEFGTVWNSADMSSIIGDIVNLPGWRSGNSITVTVSGVSPVALLVSSFDESPCFAPTLAIEIDRTC